MMFTEREGDNSLASGKTLAEPSSWSQRRENITETWTSLEATGDNDASRLAQHRNSVRLDIEIGSLEVMAVSFDTRMEHYVRHGV